MTDARALLFEIIVEWIRALERTGHKPEDAPR